MIDMRIILFNNFPVRTEIKSKKRLREMTRYFFMEQYRGADKSLVRPGRKQATAKEDFDVHISYL
jgi:hypothetical protein